MAAVQGLAFPPCRSTLQSEFGLIRSIIRLKPTRFLRLTQEVSVLPPCFCIRRTETLSSESSVAGESSQRNFEMHESQRVYMNDLKKQLEELFDEVRIMLKKGDTDNAIDLLRANYAAVKDQMNAGLKGIEQAAILDVLALGYMAVGDLVFVEHLLEMLNEIVCTLCDDFPLMDSILVHMGTLFTTLGKFEDAMLAYERGLQILENEFGNSSPFLISPLLGIAKVLKHSKESKKAIATYYRVIEILESNRGAESEELVIPLSSLGNLFIQEGSVNEAETCFSRILGIYKKAYGDHDGRVGMALCLLAHVKCAKGCVDEAISMYGRGLQLIKDTHYMKLDDYVLEKMRIDLAELLHVTGREKEGRRLLEECLMIAERSNGSEHPSSAAYLLNLATSYSHTKNFVEAERLLRTCLKMMSRTDPIDELSISVPMLHLAVTLYHLKQDDEAESLALRAFQLREAACGSNALPVAEALHCLISIKARQGYDDDHMLKNLKRLMSIQETELGHEHEETVETLKKVVFYLNKLGRRDEKLPLQRRLNFILNKYKQRVPL